jgi:hypothetical protein
MADSTILCPICNEKSEFLAHAIVAPWISELGNKPLTSSTYETCNSCDFTFFSHRYTDEELTTIYGDYRGDSFFTVRNSWEPWYSNSVNGAFTNDASASVQIKKRRDFMVSALDKVFPPGTKINGCVDFGGDYGQFFPENAIGPKVLIDLSEKAVSGVTVYRSLADLPENVDLIMNCNVIEHMTVINQIVNEMMAKVNASGYIYIELPLDKFRTRKFHKRDAYRNYLNFLSRHRRTFIAVDFLSGVFRQYLGIIPFFGVVKQSEHINYFSSDSIEKLIQQSEATVVHMSKPDFTYRVGHIKQGRVSVICN